MILTILVTHQKVNSVTQNPILHTNVKAADASTLAYPAGSKAHLSITITYHRLMHTNEWSQVGETRFLFNKTKLEGAHLMH